MLTSAVPVVEFFVVCWGGCRSVFTPLSKWDHGPRDDTQLAGFERALKMRKETLAIFNVRSTVRSQDIN